MRFAFSQEQALFRDSLRNLLARECTPSHVRAAWASDSGRAPGLWDKLAELGIVGLTVPERWGGLGLAELDLVLLLEESGRAAGPEPLLETTAVAAPLLAETADDERCAEWLPRIAAGTAIVTVGLGDSPFVSFADSADLLILRAEDALHAIPRDAVRLTPQPSVDGARRLASVEWTPRAATMLAAGNRAARASATAFDRGALAAAAELIGVARHLLDESVAYGSVRHQFGKPIGSFQAIKHQLADVLMRVELARPAVYRAAHSIAKGDAARAVHVSMAKALASDAGRLAARVALQCHGAIGYTVEHDLHLWMKRAWVLAAAWGDAAWHRARAGAAILDGETGDA